MKLETITPELARKWLASNTHNRPLRDGTVKKYAEAMRSGQWEINGETIKFAEDGTLLDGQHRLQACVDCNIVFHTYVVKGLPNKVFDTIDTGRNRVASDMLALEGAANANILAPALRMLYVHNELGSAAAIDRRLAKLITNRDILETFDKHRGIEASVSYIMGLKGLTHYVSYSVAAFCHYIFAQYDQYQADDFFLKLSKGVGLEETSPVLVLRNRLLHLNRGNASGRIETIALTIKAWNAYRKRKPVKQLRWQEGEDFPVAA